MPSKVILPTRPAATAADALEAFDKALMLRRWARKAHGDYMRYTPGTHTANLHYRNYEDRDDAADKWSDVARNWLIDATAREKSKT